LVGWFVSLVYIKIKSLCFLLPITVLAENSPIYYETYFAILTMQAVAKTVKVRVKYCGRGFKHDLSFIPNYMREL
jgi:hypothetical protein